jgi:diguanylate cyclase (GGDEF)-like protein
LTGYSFLHLWLDALYAGISLIFFGIILYFVNQKRISYAQSSLLFSGFGVVIITIGYITSNSLADGLIYMIIPTIIISLLRPSREALVWLLCYYSVFLTFNLLEIPNYPISFNVFIQLFIIHMILYMIISYYRDQERVYFRQLQDLNANLREEVTLDELTGAYNRRAFKSIIEKAISSYNLTDQSYVLAIMDVDHFKRINDNYGHLQGDMVLKAMGKHIKSKIREGDTLIRYGGEEFVICFEHVKLEKAVEIMEKMRQSIEDLTLLQDEIITVSTGLSAVEEGDTPHSLLARADIALYEAKDAGRNQVKYT